MRIFLFLISLTFLFENCSQNADHQNLINLVENLDPNYNKSMAYVIIPDAGCPGCLSAAEQILIDNIGSDKIRFLLTDILSFKEVRIKLGVDVEDYNNVILDKKNMAAKYKVSLFYPAVLYSRGERIEYISPDNPHAINNLKSYLETK